MLLHQIKRHICVWLCCDTAFFVIRMFFFYNSFSFHSLEINFLFHTTLFNLNFHTIIHKLIHYRCVCLCVFARAVCCCCCCFVLLFLFYYHKQNNAKLCDKMRLNLENECLKWRCNGRSVRARINETNFDGRPSLNVCVSPRICAYMCINIYDMNGFCVVPFNTRTTHDE